MLGIYCPDDANRILLSRDASLAGRTWFLSHMLVAFLRRDIAEIISRIFLLFSDHHGAKGDSV